MKVPFCKPSVSTSDLAGVYDVVKSGDLYTNKMKI